MRQSRSRTVVLVLVLGALMLSGCWDRIEIMDIASVRMVGIDKAQTGIRLSVRVTVPTRIKLTTAGGGGGGGDEAGGAGGAAHMATVVYSAEGETIMDATRKLQEMIPRRLFWGHAGPLILGAEYARQGVRPVLDFLSRHREPRLTTFVAVTPGTALDFTLATPAMERIIGETVREIIKQRLGVVVSVKDFLASLHTPGEHPLASRLEVVAGAPGAPETEVQQTGAAVFREDRLIGWLDADETRGVLWLRDEIETGIVTLPVPTGGKVSLQLVRGHTRVHPEFRQGQLRLVVDAITEDDIFESTAPLDLSKEPTIQVLTRLLEEELRERIQVGLDIAQRRFGVDMLRFGDAVRRGAPRVWESGLKDRWDQVFPRVPVELRVEAHVRRTGQHAAPLWGTTGEVKATERLLQKEVGGGR